MRAELAWCGWPVAATALVVALRGWWIRAAMAEALARAAHEIRGPLAAVRLGLHLGVQGAALPARRVRAVVQELDRALIALEDLDAVRERGSGPRPHGSLAAPLCLERLDLRELVAGSVEAWSLVAAERGVALELMEAAQPLLVDVDRLRLAQAVGNLLANAIEHGEGPVRVRCRADGGSVRVEVMDGGRGLPAPVEQLIRRPQRGRGDRGRGLAIAAALVARHGGRLASAPSQRGARLVLELPAVDGAHGSAGLPPG